jgi:hypothetical protein
MSHLKDGVFVVQQVDGSITVTFTGGLEESLNYIRERFAEKVVKYPFPIPTMKPLSLEIPFD